MPDQDSSFFAKLSQELMQQGAEQPTLDRVVERAIDVIPGVDFAGVSLRRRRRRVTTVASSDPRVDVCDGLQYELDQGPCLDAIWTGDAYVSNDLSSDPRWPVWGPQVSERGMHAIVAIRISDGDEAIGALNMYAGQRDAFDGHAFDIATTYGYHAANAFVSAHLVDGLESSLRSRHTIGLAQGILMKEYDLHVDQAFTVLQRYSSHHNVRLRDLATQIVEQKGLPDTALIVRRDIVEAAAIDER